MCANEFIAVSGPVARALADCGIQPDRIHPIENAVNINHFSPTETSGQTDLQNRLNKGSPLIGAVGSANPRKGWGTLLLACALLKTNYPHIRCAFIGNLEAGDVPFYGKYTYSSILTSLIKALSLEETTLFAGMQDDIPAIISGWDLLVQPSLTEAGPRAVIEAMSAGLPVVATRVGGNMDYVADGITGLLCNENDPVDLARAISQLIMDPGRREIMGREARRVAVERFSIDVHVKKVEKVYTKLLGAT
jgi:glycosyltransferase involved in cell wall biosynthesis